MSSSTTTESSASSTIASITSNANSSEVAFTSISIQVPSPNEIENPFLQTSKFKQGTFYVIILPVIGGFLLLYLLGSIYNRYKAKKQAKSAAHYDEEYDFINMTKDSFDSTDPFDDKNEDDSSCFKFYNHKKNKSKDGSSVDLVSQFRHSMDILNHHTGRTNDSKKFYNHKANQSMGSLGSVLQLNMLDHPTLQPELETTLTTTSYSQPSNFGSTALYSMVEPTKAKTQTTISIPNSKQHFHKKNLSSVILDEFITTGELPVIDDESNNVDISFNNNNISNNNGGEESLLSNSSFETHSMFENQNNNSYNADKERGRLRTSSPIRKSINRSPRQINKTNSSPRRYYNQSPSRSPIRQDSNLNNRVNM